jgi:hypothetical protein
LIREEEDRELVSRKINDRLIFLNRSHPTLIKTLDDLASASHEQSKEANMALIDFVFQCLGMHSEQTTTPFDRIPKPLKSFTKWLPSSDQFGEYHDRLALVNSLIDLLNNLIPRIEFPGKKLLLQYGPAKVEKEHQDSIVTWLCLYEAVVFLMQALDYRPRLWILLQQTMGNYLLELANYCFLIQGLFPPEKEKLFLPPYFEINHFLAIALQRLVIQEETFEPVFTKTGAQSLLYRYLMNDRIHLSLRSGGWPAKKGKGPECMRYANAIIGVSSDQVYDHLLSCCFDVVRCQDPKGPESWFDRDSFQKLVGDVDVLVSSTPTSSFGDLAKGYKLSMTIHWQDLDSMLVWLLNGSSSNISPDFTAWVENTGKEAALTVVKTLLRFTEDRNSVFKFKTLKDLSDDVEKMIGCNLIKEGTWRLFFRFLEIHTLVVPKNNDMIVTLAHGLFIPAFFSEMGKGTKTMLSPNDIELRSVMLLNSGFLTLSCMKQQLSYINFDITRHSLVWAVDGIVKQLETLRSEMRGLLGDMFGQQIVDQRLLSGELRCELNQSHRLEADNLDMYQQFACLCSELDLRNHAWFMKVSAASYPNQKVKPNAETLEVSGCFCNVDSKMFAYSPQEDKEENDEEEERIRHLCKKPRF